MLLLELGARQSAFNEFPFTKLLPKLVSKLLTSFLSKFLSKPRLFANLFASPFILCVLLSASGCTWLKPNNIHSIESGMMEAGLPPIQELKPLGSHASEIIAIFPAHQGSAANSSSNYRALVMFKNGQVGLVAPPGPRVYSLAQIVKDPRALAYDSSRALLAAADDSTVSIYALGAPTNKANKLKVNLSSLPTRISALSFDTSTSQLLVGGFDGRVYVWNFSEQLLNQESLSGRGVDYLESYIGQSSAVSALAPHPGGRVLFSGGWQGEIFAWLTYASLGKREVEQSLTGIRFFGSDATNMVAYRDDHMAVDFLKLSPDAEHIIVATQSGMIELWDVRGFKKLASLQAHNGLIYDLAMSPSWQVVASVGRDGQVQLNKIVPPKDQNSNWQFAQVAKFEADGARKLALLGERKVLLGNVAGEILENN